MTKTIGEIARNNPASVHVFEKYGIDYCCGGKRPLEDACREKGVSPASVRDDIARAMAGITPSANDWNTAPLRDVIHHIVSTHHEYLKL